MRQRPLGLEHDGSMNYIPLMMSHAFMILSIIKNRKEVVMFNSLHGVKSNNFRN